MAAPALPLSEDDLAFFEVNGYVVVRNCIPDELCDALTSKIYSTLDADPKRSDTWYPMDHPLWNPSLGFVEMYNTPEQWAIRQYPRLHQAFAQLYGTERLWVSLDRVGFKPPVTRARAAVPGRKCKKKRKGQKRETVAGYSSPGFVHWDADPFEVDSIGFELQGVLALEETTEAMGGFHCVPGMHRSLSELVGRYERTSKVDRFYSEAWPVKLPKAMEREVMPQLRKVAVGRGDLIVWRRELAHGNGCNESDRPRLAMYVTMLRERGAAERVKNPQLSLHRQSVFDRVEMVRRGDEFVRRNRDRAGDQQIKGKGSEAGGQGGSALDLLDELGERLLGVQPWGEEGG